MQSPKKKSYGVRPGPIKGKIFGTEHPEVVRKGKTRESEEPGFRERRFLQRVFCKRRYSTGREKKDDKGKEVRKEGGV